MDTMRLQRVAQHVVARPAAADEQSRHRIAQHVVARPAAADEERPRGRHPLDERFVDLPLYTWAELMEHNTEEDLWVAIDGKVFDMTEFVNSGIHPGGVEIPAEYAGKDASEYWNELHAHLKEDILEDILEGEPINTGLEDLPTLMGLIDVREPMPAEAGSAYGLERYWSRNWAGNVEVSRAPPRFPVLSDSPILHSGATAATTTSRRRSRSCRPSWPTPTSSAASGAGTAFPRSATATTR